MHNSPIKKSRYCFFSIVLVFSYSALHQRNWCRHDKVWLQSPAPIYFVVQLLARLAILWIFVPMISRTSANTRSKRRSGTLGIYPLISKASGEGEITTDHLKAGGTPVLPKSLMNSVFFIKVLSPSEAISSSFVQERTSKGLWWWRWRFI